MGKRRVTFRKQKWLVSDNQFEWKSNHIRLCGYRPFNTHTHINNAQCHKLHHSTTTAQYNMLHARTVFNCVRSNSCCLCCELVWKSLTRLPILKLIWRAQHLKITTNNSLCEGTSNSWKRYTISWCSERAVKRSIVVCLRIKYITFQFILLNFYENSLRKKRFKTKFEIIFPYSQYFFSLFDYF